VICAHERDRANLHKADLQKKLADAGEGVKMAALYDHLTSPEEST